MTGYLIIQIIFWSIVAWLIGAPMMLWRGVPAEMVPGGRALVWLGRLFMPSTWVASNQQLILRDRAMAKRAAARPSNWNTPSMGLVAGSATGGLVGAFHSEDDDDFLQRNRLDDEGCQLVYGYDPITGDYGWYYE